MTRQIEFTVGGFFDDYDTYKIFIDDDGHCEIFISHSIHSYLRHYTTKISDEQLAELDALKIFTWKEDYYDPNILDGTQWNLTFTDGDKTYRGSGSNAYPENWEAFCTWLDKILDGGDLMTRQIKFTVGDGRRGYKTVELTITGATVAYKILRGGLLDVGKKNSPAAEISDAQLAELDALEIFAWEENYSSQTHGGAQWSLTYAAGDKIYRGRGAEAYPENWSRFIDWLDAIVPELEFVNRRRLERVAIAYVDEKLTLDRNAETVTLAKKKSRHIYDASSDDIKKFFDACQKFLDGRDTGIVTVSASSRAEFEVLRHDGSIETFETYYSENFLPGLTDFANGIRELMADLSAEIFAPQAITILPRQGKYILCKVRFPGTYKLYTYRTDDETLAVGDAVDVPVGRNNEVTQARIVEIGYFEEYEAPFPIDRIKKIIGKHIAADWENF